MPYAPPDRSGEPELTVQVAGGDGEPERLLVVSRPDADGMVRVRERTSEDWGRLLEREMAATVLLAALEDAARDRRRLSEAIERIRLWLAGTI